MRANPAPFAFAPVSPIGDSTRAPVIVWVLLGALADVACAIVISLSAGLVGFGLARRLYRVPA